MKQRTITGTLMRNTAIAMAAFWLLSMLLTTWLYAGASSEAYALAVLAFIVLTIWMKQRSFRRWNY